MLLNLPSGRTFYGPLATPITWTEVGSASAGTAVYASDLERDITSAVVFHRNRSLFQGIAASTTTIPNNAWTPIPLASELVDNWGGHSDDSNLSRVRPDFTDAGDDWYLCSGYVPLAGIDAGHVGVAGIRLSGGTIYEGQKSPGATGHANTQEVVDLLRMQATTPYDATQYVELMGWQNTGASQSTVVAGKAPSLTMRWACSAVGDVVALPSTPRTWTAADILTADTTGTNKVPLNLHIRDTLRFLRYPPVARLHSTGTTQTIPTGTSGWTSLTFAGESIDNYNGHSTSTNTSRYTCQRAGLYYVYGLAAVTEPASATGYRASRLLINGTTPYGGMSTMGPASTTAGTALPASGLLRLAAGDYVEVQMQHTAGVSLAVRDQAGDCARLIALWMAL